MEVIYEDNHILVVVKPQNVPVMGDSSKDKDMLTLCKEYIKQKENKPGNVYLGLLHRLDRPTGGVMVFAKTSKAAGRISEAIREGEVEKNYFAILLGTPRERQGKLTHYLLKDEKANVVNIVPMSTEGAKKAMLEYWIAGEYSKLSLARIKLITGRTHQIRVQMNSLNTPVLGDMKYGGSTMPKGFNLALWAYELKFYHPVTKVKMVFRCYPPETKVWEAFSPVVKSIMM